MEHIPPRNAPVPVLRRAILTAALCCGAMLVAAADLAAQVVRDSLGRHRPAVPVGAGASELRLDGVLNELAWAAADSIANLTTVEPREGEAPVGRTVVRILAGADEILIGVRADDPDPRGIISFARERDATLDEEDHIKIVLDTYLDGRSGYVFAVNPNGARYDALVANQGEGENENWDAVWEAAATRTATGWSAEFRIPVRSLLFRSGLTEWGFNVERRVQRLQETSRWSGAERNFAITQTARAGLLTNIPRFELGLGVSLRPSVKLAAGIPEPDARVDREETLSLDATQRLGANTLASLTINTDFAETEVDARRTNLTRFPLFFPEKRTFFLEGADIFEFGLGLHGDLRPFFSRRIGLIAGQEIPIDVGTKINGRLGGTNFGALVVRTGRLDTLPSDNTLGVVRIKQNVLRESSVGMIATFGDPLGRSHSWLAGPDLTYQTSRFRGDKNFLIGVWGLATGRGDLSGTQGAYGFKIDYPNDLWDVSLTHKRLDELFLPSLGFVPRPSVRISNFNVTYSPRPARPVLGIPVRQMFYQFRNTLVTDLDNRWESYRSFTSPVNWRLESGDRFEFNVVPTGERLVEPFEIAERVVVPADTYHWIRYRLEAQFAAKRRVSGQLTWWFGDFYGGQLDVFELSAAWKPSPLFLVELSGERNVGRLSQGRFTQDLLGTRVRLNFSPDLQLNSFLQFDNESDSFGTNSRLRWTFHPLGDLFVVYNHNMARELIPGDPELGLVDRRRWAFSSNEFSVKVQYMFRY